MARSRPSKKPAASRDAGTSASWWTRQPAWVQHAVCLTVLAVVAFGFYAPAVFSGKTLAGGDTVSWRAMAEVMIEHREATGQEPLWDPNAFAGMPGYLISFPDQIPQLDLLPKTLRAFMWPVSHFLFLLFGTYLLVVVLVRDRWAGVLAACAYGLTTYLPIILVAGHNTKFIALCYAPWLVLSFAYALRRAGLLAGLLFAAALAVNLRADHVQITYYVTFLLGVWWLVEGVQAGRKGAWKPFGKATGWMALGGVLALLMVAQPYLSLSEYKAFSIRGASSGGGAGEGALAWDYAMAWSQGVGELWTLLIADAFGGGGALYWGPKPFTAGPHYVGGIVVALALLALWRWRRPAVWALGIGTGLMLLFALGEHLPLVNRPMFELFPLFDAFRVPETWLSIVALALAVLAGFGLALLGRDERADDAAQTTRAGYAVWGGVAAVVAVLLLAHGALFSFERPGEAAQIVQQIAASNDVSPDDPRVTRAAEQYLGEARAERADVFSGDAWRTLLMLLLGGGLFVLHRRGTLPAWTVQAGLVALVVVDLGGVGRRYFSEEDLRPAQAPEDLIARYDIDGFVLERRAEAGGPGHFRVLSLESGNPMVNARPSYYYESIGGYHGAKLRRYQDFIDHIFIDPATGLPSEAALDLLNVRYVVAPGLLPGTEPVYQGPQTGLAVLENADALPRAFFVGEVEVVEDPETQWQQLRSGAVDLRQTALVEAPFAHDLVPLDSASTARAELDAYGPRQITWNVETDAPRLLVVSEVYYPAGWNAYVDGEAVPVYPVNYLLRGVPVPAGAQTVEMRFEPSSYRNGLWIAGLSTAAVYLGLVVLLGLRVRRQKDPAPTATPVETEV